MHWLLKIARTERERIQNNIIRLENLLSDVHRLGDYIIATQSGGFAVLQELLELPLVKGRPHIEKKMQEALGNEHQKLPLDNPQKSKQKLREAEELIKIELNRERKKFKEFAEVSSLYETTN